MVNGGCGSIKTANKIISEDSTMVIFSIFFSLNT